MQLQVTITLPDSGPEAGPAAKWLGSFQSWLDVAPKCVAIEQYDGQKLAYIAEYVTVAEVKEFFMPRLPRSRVSYNARMVFYWLITNLHNHLEVRCVGCRERYMVCSCKTSGFRRWGNGFDEWKYVDLNPDSDQAEKVWLIGRKSLVKLPPLLLEQTPDRSAVRRERVKLFLQYLQGA